MRTLVRIPSRAPVNSIREPANLKLSDAQREIFAGWRRPQDPEYGRLKSLESKIGGGETDMMVSDDIDLVQDIITDCSVVASLCAGTARAKKGHGKVFSYPSQPLKMPINAAPAPCFHAFPLRP